jgi:predicted RNA-binding Zn-ribbon protein involved in translation (DUF1610 family)
MKARDLVTEIVIDKEDLFIKYSGTSKPKSKPAPSPPAAPSKPVPLPAQPKPTASTPPANPVRATVAPPPPPEPEPVVPPVIRNPLPSSPAEPPLLNDGRSGSALLKSAEYRFKFAMDRKPVSVDSEEDMSTGTPIPTADNSVQSNCINCGQYMFYKPAAALVSCAPCGFLQLALECPACGSFFPASHEADAVSCPACAARAPLDHFVAARRASFAAPPEAAAAGGGKVEVNLVVQYYRDSDAVRREEVRAH